MRLLIKHLGRIEDAELDIRPLTVLVGKNGTGKTWTAHSYFKLLERLRVIDYRGVPSAKDPMSRLATSAAEEWHTRIKQAGTESVSFSLQRVDLIDRLPDTISLTLRGPVWPSTLGVSLPPSTCVELQISREELRQGVASRIEVTVARDPLKVQKSLSIEGELEPRTTVEYPGEAELLPRLREAIEDLLFGWRKQVRALPAERVNLAQIFPALISDKNVQMPRALVDFCYMMSLASARQLQPPDSAFTDALEKLVGGHLSFEDRQLVLRPSGADSVVIPLKATASLVKSLAGLRVFLSTAVRGDVLIIDEPEMNAHPEAQMALTELFTSMVRRGIQVVVATHSPYVLDHLNTLLEASRLDPGPRERLSAQFALGSPDVYVKPDELAVYQFEPTGVVRDVLNRERGVIDWSTFTAVSDRESTILNAVVEAEESGSDAA